MKYSYSATFRIVILVLILFFVYVAIMMTIVVLVVVVVVVVNSDTNGDGEITLEEFSAFFTRNFPYFPSDQDNDSDELGVIWARLRHAKPQPPSPSPSDTTKNTIEILHAELQKSNMTTWDLRSVENLFTTCGLTSCMEEIGTFIFSAYFMKTWEIRNEQNPSGGVYDMGMFMTWLNGDRVVDVGRGDNDHEDDDGDELIIPVKVSVKRTAESSQQPLSMSMGEQGVPKVVVTDTSVDRVNVNVNRDFDARELVSVPFLTYLPTLY